MSSITPSSAAPAQAGAVASYSSSVLKLEHDQQKQDGRDAVKLIEGASEVARRAADRNVGQRVDVSA